MEEVTSELQDVISQLNILKGNTGLQDTAKQADNLRKSLNGTTKLSKLGNAFKSTIKLGVIFAGLRKGFNIIKDITMQSVDMIETTNLFEVSMGKVVDEYGNLDEAQSQYYTRAMAFQDEMNQKLGTNKKELMEFQAKFNALYVNQGVDKRTSEWLSEQLSKAGYDIASLRNQDVSTVMDKLYSGITGQTKSIRDLGVDISEGSITATLQNLGINRTVNQLSYAEKEIARYLTIVEQAKSAQGDFARTFETPANQIKVFKNQLIELKQVAGSFFVGLFGQIMPYINGIIMAIKEVLKALGAVFGFNIDVGGSSLGAVDDTVGDIETGLGGATAKAKEFKKQLMGFDEINNIEPPSSSSGGSGGGVPTGVDSALLNSLKEWDNMMDKISGKAQEIRDKILDWLGVTDGSYENLKRILEIAKLVGIAISSWKIAKTVTNFFKNMGKLNGTQAFQLATGITLTITGMVAQFAGTKQLLDGNWTLFNLLETVFGTSAGALGITSILKALTKGKITFGKGLTIGFGVMFEIQSLQTTIDTMQKLKAGVIDTTDAFSRMTISMGEAIGAGAMLGYQLGGLKGALVGGLVGALTTAITAWVTYRTALSETGKKLEETKTKIEEIDTGYKNLADTYEKNIDAINKNKDASLSELEVIKKQTEQLGQYLDENGKVKKGQEELVQYILNDLNKAFGTNYEIVNDHIVQNGEVVKSYQDICNSIDDYIAKRKKEIEAEVYEEEYKEKIKYRIELEKKLKEVQEEKLKAYNELIEANTELTKSTYGVSYAQADMERSLANKNYIDLINKEKEYSKELEGTKEEIEKLGETYGNTISSIYGVTSTTGEQIPLLFQEQMESISSSTTNTADRITGILKTSTNEQLSIITKNAKEVIQQVKEKGEKATKEEKEALERMLENLGEKLIEQTGKIEELTPEQINAWQTLAEGSEKIYNEKISQVNEDTRLLLDTINGKVDISSPEFQKKWEKMSEESRKKFNAKLNGIDKDTSTKIQSAINEINNKQQSAQKSGEGLANAVEKGTNTIDTTEAGKQAVAGVTKGINQNKNSWSLKNAISGVVSNVKKWFNDLLGIHSPSKVFANLASYIPEGIAKGITDNIDATIKPMKELTSNITKAFSSNIDIPNITKELNQGIKIDPTDFVINTNQYIDYGAIKGKILAQSQVSMEGSISGEIRQAVIDGMRNARIAVEVEGKADKDGIFKIVQTGAKEYTMQTGEPAFEF